MNQISEIIMKFNSISVPNYLCYDSNIKSKHLIHMWIKYRTHTPTRRDSHYPQSGIRDGSLEQRSCIPEELLYPGCQFDRNGTGDTPINGLD